MDLTNRKTLFEILTKYDLFAKKRFGQNFLISREDLEKIVETGEIKDTDHILEIGPGLGTLTLELCKKAKKVTTIEADKTLIPVLKENLRAFGNIEIINADALKTPPPKGKYKVIANIPYQITSPLLTLFLTAENRPEKIVFLVQKEVAEKICNTKKQSILSLQVQMFGNPKIIQKIPRTHFYPAPKVESAILKIDVYEYPLAENPKKVMEIAKKAFSKKRKKLSNSIKTADIRFKDKRPEDLHIKDWETILQDEKLV